MVVCGWRAVLWGSRRSWEGAKAAGPWGREIGAAGQSQRRPQLISSGATVGGPFRVASISGKPALHGPVFGPGPLWRVGHALGPGSSLLPRAIPEGPPLGIERGCPRAGE